MTNHPPKKKLRFLLFVSNPIKSDFGHLPVHYEKHKAQEVNDKVLLERCTAALDRVLLECLSQIGLNRTSADGMSTLLKHKPKAGRQKSSNNIKTLAVMPVDFKSD